MDANDGTGGAQEQEQADAVLPVLAFDGAGDAIALAFGSQIRVYDNRSGSAAALTDATSVGPHTDTIRSIAFSLCGKWMATGGDDKLFKLWECATWTCKWSIRQPKKVCAVAFCPDSLHVLFANKFGDVNIVPVDPTGAAPPGEPELLFGHWCSVITSLTVTPDGRFVVTADRDNKVRVSVLPPSGVRMGGAHAIQAFCLGHTAFVTAAAAVLDSNGHPQAVLSGGGDGTVRMWDHLSGAQSARLDVDGPPPASDSGGKAGSAAAGAAGADGAPDKGPEGDCGEAPVVSALAVGRDGVAAVVVEGLKKVLLLKVDCALRTLEVAGSVELPGLGVEPMTVAFAPSGLLWAVAGAVVNKEVTLVVAAATSAGEARALPQGTLDALLGSGYDASAAAEALRGAAGAAGLSAMLRKRKYDQGDLENRKKHRRDKATKEQKKGAGAQQGAKAWSGRLEAAAGGGAVPKVAAAGDAGGEPQSNNGL